MFISARGPLDVPPVIDMAFLLAMAGLCGALPPHEERCRRRQVIVI
jgi:hypothetical protein